MHVVCLFSTKYQLLLRRKPSFSMFKQAVQITVDMHIESQSCSCFWPKGLNDDSQICNVGC